MDLESVAPSWLSEPLRERVRPYYFRYRSLAADRDHTPAEGWVDRQPDAPKHVLLVIVDALRPDFVLDLPLESTHVVASAPWTFPSVTSIHTGTRPSDHKAVAHSHPDDEEFAMPAQTDADPVFPRVLEAAGYETYAGCGFLMPLLALGGWYQTHQCFGDSPAQRVIDAYHDWRSGRDRTASYLHLSDLHAPVTPPESYVERYDVDRSLPELGRITQYRTDFDPDSTTCRHYREQKIRLHLAAMDYVSGQLNCLLSEVGDNTLVIVTGDHGESLWEHQDHDRQMTDSRPNYCFGHGGTPFDALARVPLLTNDKDLLPTGGWGSTRDIPKTVLGATIEDVEVPGHDWATPIPADRAVVCEGARYGAERKAVYRGERKLIRSETDDVTLTARVTEDDERFVDLPDDVVADLLAVLPDSWDDMDVRASVSGATQSQLEALGYH